MVSKMTLPNYDGSGKIIACSWAQKMDTYLSLSPMMEEDAIKLTILHLEGTSHDWWHHGLITQDHQHIITYDEFTQKIIKIFDQKHPEWYFKELTQLKQHGTMEDYAMKFQKLSVMVPKFSQSRLTYLFVEGLKESI